MLSIVLAMLQASAPPAPPSAQQTAEKEIFAKLEPGKVMTFQADGRYNIADAPALQAGDLELIAPVVGAGEDAMGANSLRTSTDKDTIPITPDRLDFHMAYMGKDSLLLVRNGFGKSVRYQLLIKTEQGVSRTDVCEVFDGIRASEHWPYRIEWMAIGKIELFDRKGKDRPTCE